MRALRQYMNSIEQRAGVDANPRASSSKKRKGGSADDDAPQRSREERAANHAKRAGLAARAAEEEAEEGGGGGGGWAGDDFEDDGYVGKRGGGGGGGGGGKKQRREAAPIEEDPFYAEMAGAQQQRKVQKADRRAAKAKADSDAIRNMPTDSAKPGSKREINRAIEKNRGLTRQRKKIDSNPRVKNREKFRKATIRRNGVVRAVKEASAGPYAGEATGIKKNLSHSTRLSK